MLNIINLILRHRFHYAALKGEFRSVLPQPYFVLTRRNTVMTPYRRPCRDVDPAPNVFEVCV